MNPDALYLAEDWNALGGLTATSPVRGNYRVQLHCEEPHRLRLRLLTHFGTHLVGVCLEETMTQTWNYCAESWYPAQTAALRGSHCGLSKETPQLRL